MANPPHPKPGDDPVLIGHRPLRTSSPLPPYRAVLAVDTEKYTRNSSHHQQVLSGAVQTVLEEAFRRSGLDGVWKERRFPQSTGDGYVIGVEPENLPYLIHPLLGHLQETLEDTQPRLASHDRELRLRLRASIDVGPLPDSQGREPLDGIGQAMNDTHRLLDSDPVRAELSRSDPDITLLAVIISRRVYEDAVLGGFVGLNKRRFHSVDVALPDKEFEAEGRLYIPVPSVREDSDSLEQSPARASSTGAVRATSSDAPGVAETPAQSSDLTPSVSNQVGDNSGQTIQSGVISGGIHNAFGKGD